MLGRGCRGWRWRTLGACLHYPQALARASFYIDRPFPPQCQPAASVAKEPVSTGSACASPSHCLQVLAFVGAHTAAGAAQLAGNSVHVDAAFLRRCMPRVAAHLHYRIVDVSTIMELCRRWYPRAYRRAPRKKASNGQSFVPVSREMLSCRVRSRVLHMLSGVLHHAAAC